MTFVMTDLDKIQAGFNSVLLYDICLKRLILRRKHLLYLWNYRLLLTVIF